MAYSRDTEIELQGTFKDAAGQLVDPTEVTVEVQNPAGTTTSYTLGAAQVTRASLGVFTRRVTLDAKGDWHYRFKGTGTVNVADWKLITIETDPFA